MRKKLKVLIILFVLFIGTNVYAESILKDNTNFQTKTYKSIHLAMSDIKDANLNDVERINYMGDFLQNGTYYGFSTHHQTYYGVLGDGYAVCAGHNDAARYLTSTAGTNCFNIVSDSANHMMTVCYFDHDWYYYDATGADSDMNLDLEKKRYDVRSEIAMKYYNYHPAYSPTPDPYNYNNTWFFGRGVSNLSFRGYLNVMDPMPNGQEIDATKYTYFDQTYRYYLEYNSTSRVLYRKNRTTGVKTKLADVRSKVVVGTSETSLSYGLVKDYDYFYYINKNDNKVYKIKKDGTSKTKVSDTEAISLWRTDDKIYIFNKTDGVKVIGSLSSYPKTGTYNINDGTSSYQIIYAYNNNGATIMGVDGINGGTAKGIIQIPETLGGVPVIGIAPKAFYQFDRSIVTENLKLPSSLLYIGEYAFEYTNIKNVTFNSKLLSIGESAFADGNLAGKLVIPNSVEYIGYRAFYNNLIEDVEFKGDIELLNDGVFQNNKLTEAKIPDSVEVYSSYRGGAYARNGIENLVFGSKLKYLQFHDEYDSKSPAGLKNVVINSKNLIYIDKGSIDLNTVKFYAHAGTTTAATLTAAGIEYINLDTLTYKIENDSNVTVDLSIKTKQLTYSVNPSFLKYTENWKSSNTSVATVDSKGLLTLKSKGTTTVTLTLSTGQSTTFKVTVTDNPITKINFSIPRVIEDDRFYMRADITPSDADKTGITWTSSDPSIFSIDSYEDDIAMMTAKKAGNATITIKAPNGVKKDVQIKVYAKVKAASIIYPTNTIYVGDTFTLDYKVTADGEYYDGLYYEVDKPDMVDISGKTIHVKKAGDCTFYLYDHGKKKKATTILTFKETIPITAINVYAPIKEFYVGGTFSYNATIEPSNTTDDKTITWTSSNTSVATITSSGKLTAVGIGKSTITVKASNGIKKSFEVTVKPDSISEKEISLNKTSLSLVVGKTETLTATITPSNATNKTVTWTSSNSSIATVSNGKITAVSAGTAIITAKTNNGKKATCVVTITNPVIEATGISLNKTSLSLVVGKTETLTATITPSNTSNKKITWTSSNSSAATVLDGKITAVRAGTVTITAKTSNGKTATCKVTITESTVAETGVSLNKTNLSLVAGKTETLIATVTPSNATNKTVTWTSNNTKIATVSNGKVTAVSAGTVTITAKTANGKTATCKITVTASTVAEAGVKLNKTSLSLEKGKNTTLTATVTPSNATNKTVTWTSSNTKVATVTNGKVVGIAEGTATITVKTNNGKTATCKVTVTKPVFRVNYRTQVQDIGWQGYVSNGAMSGTSGKSKRLEAIKIKLENAPYSGNIEYRTHIQDIGWETSFKKNDTMSGTEHQSKRLEAIEIKLTGDISKYYDVYYRVHAEHFGWMGWAKNGEQAGSASYSYRLEGIEIVLVEKGKNPPTRTDTRTKKSFMKKQVAYTTHVQDYGWQKDVFDGEMSGTSHQSKRLEGIKIKLYKQDATGNIEYMTHIQDIGWEKSYKKNGEMSGTSHQSKRLEAIKIRLTGNMAKKYDIYYRVHAQNFGWMGWAKNGEEAGTAHYSYRLEGIEIVLVEKGENPPERTDTKTKKAFVDKKAK